MHIAIVLQIIIIMYTFSSQKKSKEFLSVQLSNERSYKIGLYSFYLPPTPTWFSCFYYEMKHLARFLSPTVSPQCRLCR